jgi:hypothetical protein
MAWLDLIESNLAELEELYPEASTATAGSLHQELTEESTSVVQSSVLSEALPEEVETTTPQVKPGEKNYHISQLDVAAYIKMKNPLCLCAGHPQHHHQAVQHCPILCLGPQGQQIYLDRPDPLAVAHQDCHHHHQAPALWPMPEMERSQIFSTRCQSLTAKTTSTGQK